MAASSSATLSDLKEEELKNKQIQQLLQSFGNGASSDKSSSPPAAASQMRRKRNHPGNPSPDAEVVQLSPKALMATNRFLCEVCNKGFQREQNLQLHRRGHNLPWKLKQRTNREVRKKVYTCPELNCVHHHPARALGDLTGIKKHFFRKHGEKKFNCDKCNKKYAVRSDWKAHNKICGTKDYKCDCGTSFSRRDSFMYHRSFCDVLVEDVARHKTNHSPYSSMAASILANATYNPGSVSLDSATGSLIPGNHQQVSSPIYGQSIESAFQPGQLPPYMTLQYPNAERKLSFPRASEFSGIYSFRSYTASSSTFNFGINGSSAELNSSQNDLDLNTNNSFTGLMMSGEATAYNILNSSTLPSPQLPATALLQKAAMTGAYNSNNACLMKSMGSSMSAGMKFSNYGPGALGDGMLSGGGGGRGGADGTFEGMYNNSNVGGGSFGGAGGYGGGMEYLSDQMNALYGGMMYNANNTDGMLVGGENMNNVVVVEPQVNIQGEYCDKLTRDFLGMGNGMDSLGGGGMAGAYSGTGMGTSSPDSEATISAEAGPFVPGRSQGF